MKKITIFAFTILLFTACRKDIHEVHPGQELQGLPASKSNLENIQVTRPIKVELNSSADPASPALNCTLPGVPFAITNSGYFLRGTATHLGIINAETSMGIDGSCHLDPATFILATTTSGQIVSANGDMFTYTGIDAIDLNNIIFHGGTTAAITGVWTITGGTGRFVGATGSFSISGIVDVTAAGGPAFSVTGEGSITY